MNESSIIATYSSSHQNKRNQLIHFVCVPIIFLNVFALIYAFTNALITGTIVFATLIFYFRSMRSFLPHMIVLYGVVLGICAIFADHQYFVHANIILFVVAWVGQFWGHKIEGKKPSFFQDVFFLLVGPAWVAEKMRKKITGSP